MDTRAHRRGAGAPPSGGGRPDAGRPWSRALPAAAAAAIVLGACGAPDVEPVAVGAASAAGTGGPSGEAPTVDRRPLTDLHAVPAEVGTAVESEPTPMGTLITGPSAADVFWVQALTDDGARDFDAIATEDAPQGRLRRPADGMAQLRVTRHGVHRLIGARAGADPARVADAAFTLDTLPAGWRFVATTPAASAALAPDREGTLPEGVTALRLTDPSGPSLDVRVAPGRADALAGLLKDLVPVAPGTWSGAAVPDDEVVLLDHPDGERVLIVRSADHAVDDLLGARQEILRAAADTRGS